MEKYRYPVYFEVDNLDSEQKEKVTRYFQVRRKSGGGYCRPVEKVHDNIFKIAFIERTVQERVLQKPEHVLDMPGGPLTLTLRGGLEPSPTSTTSPITSPMSHHHSLPAATSPSGGQECILQVDSYLQRYLKESPRAGRDLEEELSFLGCSLQLRPEDGRVVVRGPGQAVPDGAVDGDGDGDGAGQWKTQVETLFGLLQERYHYHYEVDPRKLQGLLQSPSMATGGDVRVYSEAGQGFAVVVGERAEVQARLRELEVFSPVKGQEGSGVIQEQVNTTCRLGEAKLCLFGTELERGLGGLVPGVRVTRKGLDQLVLEGSAGEIRTAREWVAKKASLVQERVVPGVSPHLLAFLRDVYGDPGALRTLLGLGAQVEVDLGHTELRLFTLSSGQLVEAENALLREFGEETIDVPNCAGLPSELRDKLEMKSSEMNQGSRRVTVRFSPGCRVQLLGHKRQIEELKEEIGEFLIDQSSVEETVRLPYPEIVDSVPELLERIGVDHSGVTLCPVVSSTHPSVVLSGPSHQVTQVKNILVPALASLVRDTVTIDQPGALRYFQGQGRDHFKVVGCSQHCLIQLQDQVDTAPRARPRQRQVTVTAASYRLQSGLQVQVCQGDITKERADVLVNAANEDLDHAGGVAAALSRAAGPEVQQACRTLVKQIGKVATGSVVETVGGNLPCKMLFHAVGPVGGSVGGKEMALLQTTAKAALDLAETLQLQTLAMPCISSGIFGVPLQVCAEAVVSAVRDFGRVHLRRSLNKVTLIDVNGEAVRAMQEACDRLLEGRREASGREGASDTTAGGDALQRDATAVSSARGAVAPEVVCVQVEIVQGSIERQQVDALVSPMLGHDPLSSRVGNVISDAAGPGLKAMFARESGGLTKPGDKVLVEGLSGLSSGRVFFLHCARWDNNPQGPAVQALRQGVRRVLDSCENRGFGSVAFPVLGTGVVLGFPHDVAAQVMLEEIRTHEQNRAGRTPFLVRVVIHPSDRQSTKAFQASQRALHLKGFTNDAHPMQASFYRYVSSSQDEVTAMLGGVKLQLVFGDIISETTDIIVNTTTFSADPSGVSKAILTAAGPNVQAALAQVGPDLMLTTGPGALGCKEIIHAAFKCDPQRISKVCGKILKQCETKGYRSAAFPAINTGAGGMDSGSASKAMLDGMASAVRDLIPNVLCLIRIVILQKPIFHIFRSELESRLGTIAPTLTLTERALQVLKKRRTLEKGSNTSPHSPGSRLPPTAPPGCTVTPVRPPPAVLCVVGLGTGAVSGAKRELQSILQNQLTERKVEAKDLWMLGVTELNAVQEKARTLGVSLEPGRARGAQGAGAASGGVGPGEEEFYVLKGLKEDVLSVREVLDRAISGALRRDLREGDEALLAVSVQWSMQGHSGDWGEMGLHANYLLEQAHLRGDVSADVEGPDGNRFTVNLRNNTATDYATGRTYRVKREEGGAKLPSYWDPMAPGETLKKVQLAAGSQEYQTVAQGFQSTTGQFTIRKIERLQNIYLWQAYAVLERRMLTKNGPGEVGEKNLYHGTAVTNCNPIENNGFNRSYSHTAAYGVGVYFAVKASYSANHRYSPPDSSGHQRIYVARVLVGRYTLGNPTMRFPPPRSSNDSTDCYDSLVDNQQTPSMFVVFHDDQAYPEYLITFS